VNMFAHWCLPFFLSSWNLFDLVVVTIGCMGFFVDFDGPLKLLRTLRAFRVFRLFRRVESLNKILIMITSAIPGVMNAFLVIVLAISIYAMVAVEFFASFAVRSANSDTNSSVNALTAETDSVVPCAYQNVVSKELLSADTARQLCHGVEYFGTFTRAWFSLFQVLTGDSWAEAQARPLLFGWDDYGGASALITVAFYVSFIVLNTFILMNVFVAVLLDKVMSPDPLPDWTDILRRLDHEDRRDGEAEEAQTESIRADSGEDTADALLCAGATSGNEVTLAAVRTGNALKGYVDEAGKRSSPQPTRAQPTGSQPTGWSTMLSKSVSEISPGEIPKMPPASSTSYSKKLDVASFSKRVDSKDRGELGPVVAALLARNLSEKRAGVEIMTSKEQPPIELLVEALLTEQQRMRTQFDAQIEVMTESLRRIEQAVTQTAVRDTQYTLSGSTEFGQVQAQIQRLPQSPRDVDPPAAAKREVGRYTA